jgi:hypothetical protein
MLISKNIINYHKSLDTLKILTFWDIIKHKNIFLLDYDYEDKKEYSEAQFKEIEDTWLKLYDEYYIMLNDSQSKHKMNKTFDELKIRDKINQIKYNYDFLVSLLKYNDKIDVTKYEQETYKRLKVIDERIKPKYFEGIEANLKNLDRVIKALVNKYNLEHKENVKTVQKEIDNVYEVVASAESWLERSLPINEMVVSHWIAIQKQIKLKQKAQQKNGK